LQTTLAGYRRGQGHSLVFKVTLPLLRSSLLSGAIVMSRVDLKELGFCFIEGSRALNRREPSRERDV
jgi:hypothetical protein